MAARAVIESVAGGMMRAVCLETGMHGAPVRLSTQVEHAERAALWALSDVCDCDDYHSTMEGFVADETKCPSCRGKGEIDEGRGELGDGERTWRKCSACGGTGRAGPTPATAPVRSTPATAPVRSSDIERQAIIDAIQAEMAKAELNRRAAQAAAETAKFNLERAEARKRELEAVLVIGGSVVGALEEAEVVATGVFSADFSPNDRLRLELVQGLKDDDFERMCTPSRPDRTAPLVVRVLGEAADKTKQDFRPMDQREEWHVLVLMRRMKKAKT